MAIMCFNEAVMETKKNDFIVDESFIVDEAFDQVRVSSGFDVCIGLLNEAEETLDEGESLEESVIDDIGESLSSLITLITKGRQEMLKKSLEAADQANTYSAELKKFASVRDVKRYRSLELYEYYTVTYVVGDTTFSQTTYRTPKWSQDMFSFDQVKQLADAEDVAALKKLYKSVRRYEYELTKFAPTILKKRYKGALSGLAKMLEGKITEQKAASKKYGSRTEEMLKNLEKGKGMLKDAKSDRAKTAIKFLRKFVGIQKRMYVHDTNLLNVNNLMILRQSRDIAKFIKKFNEYAK